MPNSLDNELNKDELKNKSNKKDKKPNPNIQDP